MGYACTTPREAEEAASKIGAGPWVVKCQVLAGGRGKAGGVKVVNLSLIHIFQCIPLSQHHELRQCMSEGAEPDARHRPYQVDVVAT